MADIIPVDFVANSLIVIGYYSAIVPEKRKKVINITSGAKNPISWGNIINLIYNHASLLPSNRMIRPIYRLKDNHIIIDRIQHYFRTFFLHFLFAHIFDFIRLLMGKNGNMVRTMKRINRILNVINYFCNNQWQFRNDNYEQIYRTLSINDQREFPSNVSTINWNDYSEWIWIGIRRYLLDEMDSTIENAIRRQRKLYIIYGLINLLIFLSILIILVLFYQYQVNSSP